MFCWERKWPLEVLPMQSFLMLTLFHVEVRSFFFFLSSLFFVFSPFLVPPDGTTVKPSDFSLETIFDTSLSRLYSRSIQLFLAKSTYQDYQLFYKLHKISGFKLVSREIVNDYTGMNEERLKSLSSNYYATVKERKEKRLQEIKGTSIEKIVANDKDFYYGAIEVVFLRYYIDIHCKGMLVLGSLC
jgi:hypothetical protein